MGQRCRYLVLRIERNEFFGSYNVELAAVAVLDCFRSDKWTLDLFGPFLDRVKIIFKRGCIYFTEKSAKITPVLIVSDKSFAAG